MRDHRAQRTVTSSHVHDVGKNFPGPLVAQRNPAPVNLDCNDGGVYTWPLALVHTRSNYTWPVHHVCTPRSVHMACTLRPVHMTLHILTPASTHSASAHGLSTRGLYALTCTRGSTPAMSTPLRC